MENKKESYAIVDLCGNNNFISGEINDYFGFSEKIKSQQSLDRAFGRKVMTDYIQISNFYPKALERWYDYNGNKHYAACRGNLNVSGRFNRVNSYGQCAFKRNHGARSAGINSEFNKGRIILIGNFSFTQDKSVSAIEFKFFHRLKYYVKGSSVSFRKFIFRAFHQHILPALKRKKLVVDFISMGTVREKFSRDGGSSRFISFIYGYKEPFAMEPLFNACDILVFHNYHLIFKDIIDEHISQGDLGNRDYAGQPVSGCAG